MTGNPGNPKSFLINSTAMLLSNDYVNHIEVTWENVSEPVPTKKFFQERQFQDSYGNPYWQDKKGTIRKGVMPNGSIT